jgi:hypothetical protein
MQRVIFVFLVVLTANAICPAQAPMKLQSIKAEQEDPVADDTTKAPDNQRNPSEAPKMVASAQAPAPQAPAPVTAPNQQVHTQQNPNQQQVTQQQVTQQLPPQQEITGRVATLPSIPVGPARLRVGGYLGLTGLFRSTNSGGNTGTNFATIPYKDTVEGNVNETRISPQASRLSLRVDAEFPERNRAPKLRKLAGYFEMDFGGVTPDTVALTSSSFGFRLRQAFMLAEFGENSTFNLAAGQAFSLMTPSESQLSIWPADDELTQAVDGNYVVGLVWGRFPQFRATWLPSTKFSWAASVENPEQQIGSNLVVLPLCCSTDLDLQYNTGSDELRVPNLRPDVVTRVAIDPVKSFHIDVGGVFRTFRHIVMPIGKDLDFRKNGVGASANLRFNLLESNKVILQGSYGSGFGRYIGGLVPDVIFRRNSSISPIRTWSWVSGIEQKVSKWTLGGYYSGLYTYRNVALDTDGFIGFGFPNASLSNNRFIQEGTLTATMKIWETEDRGSIQVSLQGSELQRQPWAPKPGLDSAKATLFFAQIRYNLP